MLIMWFLLKLMIVSETPWKNHAYSFTIDIAANKSFIIPFCVSGSSARVGHPMGIV